MNPVLAVLVLWAILAALGRYIAEEKGRNPREGALLAILFGPFGILLEALLPTDESAVEEKRRTSKAQLEQDRLDFQESRERFRRKQEAAARRAEWEKKKARNEYEELLEAKDLKPGPLAWFFLLPDLVQALLLGLAIPALLFGLFLFFRHQKEILDALGIK